MSEVNIKPFPLDAEVGRESQFDDVPGRVQRQPVSRHTTKLHVRRSRVYHHRIVDAPRSFLQVEIHKRELNDEAGRSLHEPPAGMGIGVLLGVAGRLDHPLGVQQNQVTFRSVAAQNWR